jgi:hypothetical protein
MRVLGEPWTSQPEGKSLEVRNDIEFQKDCCGWGNSSIAGCAAPYALWTCDKAIGFVVGAYAAGMAFGNITVFLIQLVFGSVIVYLYCRIVGHGRAPLLSDATREPLHFT